MREDLFTVWLKARYPKKTSWLTFLNETKKIRRHKGDLDTLFAADCFADLLRSFECSKRTNVQPADDIPHDADPFVTARFRRQCIKLYREFCYDCALAKQSPDSEFEAQVTRSIADNEGRTRRLKDAAPKPKRQIALQVTFQRNPDVVAEVLKRAAGICACCRKKAPFRRASDNTPFLEVHHKMFLSDGGDDTVANAEALCPNCHRQKHYGEPGPRD